MLRLKHGAVCNSHLPLPCFALAVWICFKLRRCRASCCMSGSKARKHLLHFCQPFALSTFCFSRQYRKLCLSPLKSQPCAAHVHCPLFFSALGPLWHSLHLCVPWLPAHSPSVKCNRSSSWPQVVHCLLSTMSVCFIALQQLWHLILERATLVHMRFVKLASGNCCPHRLVHVFSISGSD